MSGQLDALLSAIDEVNAGDPNELVVEGRPQPKELAHSEMVTDWVRRLDPQATEEQLIAARAHHLRRWALPRSDYPDGRSGYLRWRKELGERHRAEVAAMMADHGYTDSSIERVVAIMAKRGLASDPAVQAHEDALCMVFLETQLDDLIDRLGDDKAVDVVAKSMRKMSAHGIAEASAVAYSERGADVVRRAVAVHRAES